MANTSNLGLKKLQGSDYVTVDTFNENYDVLDKLGVDYVVATGTDSNGWWYRKWNSGYAECSIADKNFGDVAINLTWGAMFASNQLTFGAYPFAFKNRPFVTVSFNGSSDAGSEGKDQQSYPACAASTSTTTSPYFRLIDPYSNSHSNVRCGIYVFGFYK